MITKTTKARADRPPADIASVDVLRCSAENGTEQFFDDLAREEPLEIRVRGRSIAVTMRTPGHDKELAVGFLLTEGLIKSPGDIVNVSPCRHSKTPENTLNVLLSPAVEVNFERLTRHVFATSSCGLCGKASIESVHQQFPPVTTKMKVSRKILASLPERMRKAQQNFEATGGLHAAGIFDARGKLVVLREDVGRHNAVDKVLGHGLLEKQLPFDSHILLVSGRASFEIVQKALAGRVPIICAISAPSSLAVDFARENGQTLVGFLRGQSLNIYSRPERIAEK